MYDIHTAAIYIFFSNFTYYVDFLLLWLNRRLPVIKDISGGFSFFLFVGGAEIATSIQFPEFDLVPCVRALLLMRL